MSKVLIQESSYETCQAAIEQVFETFPMDLKGKRVCIKVNGVAPKDPHEYAFVTDYRFVRAVLNVVEKFEPAEIVVGDSVGTGMFGKSEAVWESTHLREAAGKYFKNFSTNLELREVERPIKKTVAIIKDVLDADVYISLPKLKTHGLTIITGAVKNNYGLYAGLQKSKWHYDSITPENFAHAVVESYKLRKPDLIIIDGILSQMGYGPASLEVNRTNKVIAGTDGVAMDTVFTDMLGLTVDDIPLLRICREQNLGETDLSKIEVIGNRVIPEYWHVPVPPLCSYAYRVNDTGGTNAILPFRERAACRPVVDMAICATCETCAEEPLCVAKCPIGALSKNGDTITCATDKCLQCTSCMERCPVKAAVLQIHPEIFEALTEREKKCYPLFV
ncbi:MAG: DUF362 domain-containing protein [Oscillospiraceae bacterium]|nr:DUF362 domain-containing protein [Oscillospiraceae bacterium]